MSDYIPGNVATAPSIDYIPPGKTGEDMLREVQAAKNAIMNAPDNLNQLGGSGFILGNKAAFIFGESMRRAGGGQEVVIGAPIPAAEFVKKEEYRDVLKEEESENVG